MQDYSKDSMIAFLYYLKKKGLMKAATVDARKAAVNSMLDVLDTDESADVREVDLDDLLTRFANLKGAEFTPASLSSYKSRYKSALKDFLAYKKNPLEFKPSLATRTRGKKKGTDLEDASITEAREFAAAKDEAVVYSDQESIVFPIPLRAGLVVKIAGIPSDLTRAEAMKISSVIQALAIEEPMF